MSATSDVRPFHESYVRYEEHMSARCDNDISQSQMVMENTPILSKLYTKTLIYRLQVGINQKCQREEHFYPKNA